ncbi:malate dehydrogenase [Populibacterium corticicola]|uniref:Malate dehydrogenase n=1 Tax=Populibacterium corticicola TaxID=1812826 RepID=A0ABW5XIB0_9MICO
MTQAVNVTITGGAGQIGYALAFRIAHGDVFGPEVPVNLHLLEIPAGVRAAEGVAMELDDSAFPLLNSVHVHDNARSAFDGTNMVAFVGARPRSKGMERADLLEANGGIFGPQGTALGEHAAPDVRALVIGNPANTNAAILAAHAPDIPAGRITAMTRLDHNRAVAMLAKKTGAPAAAITRMSIWGNHSPTQYPDLFHALIDGVPATEKIDDHEWVAQEFVPRVAQRGTEIIQARGASSAASAASATIDHLHDWVHGTPKGDWTSVAMPSDGSYGVPEGLMCSFPMRSINGEWEIVQGLEISDFSQGYIDISVEELKQELKIVEELGFTPGL